MKRYISAALIIVLGFIFCAPTEAQKKPDIFQPGSSIGISKGQAAGIVVGVVAVAAAVTIITVVVIKKSKGQTLTGCVSLAPGGMILTDENDKRIYALLGEMSGVKAGERMSLKGKKIKPEDGNPRGLEVVKVRKDFGACPP
jgi:hypothetical protein